MDAAETRNAFVTMEITLKARDLAKIELLVYAVTHIVSTCAQIASLMRKISSSTLWRSIITVNNEEWICSK